MMRIMRALRRRKIMKLKVELAGLEEERRVIEVSRFGTFNEAVCVGRRIGRVKAAIKDLESRLR